MSRRAFKPTAEQRGNVEAMTGYGIPTAEICLLIKNPETSKPIDLATLRKHFAREIATGATKLKALVAGKDGAAGFVARVTEQEATRK
jgi:hypothetical protein